jgi:Tol biopolymer transport system component
MPDEGLTRLLSVSPEGKPVSGAEVQMADGGRYAVYLGDDTQIYLRDLKIGGTKRVSAAPDGSPGNDWSFAPAISADGNVVAFFSLASNLAEDPYRECPQEVTDKCGSLYIYEVGSGRIERLGLATGQLPSGLDTALSADGRYVALAIPSGFRQIGVFLYDRATNVLTTIYSGDLSRSGRTDVGAVAVDISADGRWVAFVAPDNGIVPDDENNSMDVFLYDRVTGGLERVSKPRDGIESGLASGFQYVPNTGGATESGLALSADGRYVVYMSVAPNLVDRSLPPCEHWWPDVEQNTRVVFPACRHIYLYDRQMGTTELISVSNDSAPGDYASWDADISADGRWIVFTSFASNLTAQRPSGCKDYSFHGLCPQVYLRDRLEGRTYLVSRSAEGRPAEAASHAPAITSDGGFAAFTSGAGDLVPGIPFNQHQYAFITDLPRLLSVEN